jgi:hypothetical protein
MAQSKLCPGPKFVYCREHECQAWWKCREPQGTPDEQMEKLGDFFLSEHPEWIGEGGAVDNAIRVMREFASKQVAPAQADAEAYDQGF